MKNQSKKTHAGIFLLGSLFFLPTLHAQTGEDFFTLAGRVQNAKNKQRIEYVYVSAAGTNIGTVTNENGEFSLKIGNDLDVQEIELSCIGYYNATYGIERVDRSGLTFVMEPRAVALQEVEVLSWKHPSDLVEEAIRKIGRNYSLTPNLFTCFYRETIQKRRKYITVSEAVTEVYKSSYQNDGLGDRTQVLKGRKLLSPEAKDTIAVKLLGGPNMAIYVDVVKNPDILLDERTLHFYSFKMGERISINDRLQYTVHFQPQIIADYPLYEGTYYIDRETLAFTRITFRMEMRDREKVSRVILRNKPLGLRFTPEEVAYTVTYQYQDGKSYLNYIRDEIRFRCDWKRRLFATPYTVISEMVVTDRREENVEKITARNAFPERKSLSDEAMTYYDSNFWGAYNIIEPTESLESAVGKLKKAED
jgi:hypothetical protein